MGGNVGGWPTNKDAYTNMVAIGKGAFGEVYQAHCPEKCAHCTEAMQCAAKRPNVAIKKMKLQSRNDIEAIHAEVKIARRLKHKNLLNIHCSFPVGEELWLVIPLCEKGSLADAVRPTKGIHGLCPKCALEKTPPNPSTRTRADCEDCYQQRNRKIATILHQVLEGLVYFHKQSSVHRDVKAANILLAADGTVQLCDYGVSKELISRRDFTRDFAGTLCFMAPEVLDRASRYGYNEKADIWSFGITALEIAFGEPPFSYRFREVDDKDKAQDEIEVKLDGSWVKATIKSIDIAGNKVTVRRFYVRPNDNSAEAEVPINKDETRVKNTPKWVMEKIIGDPKDPKVEWIEKEFPQLNKLSPKFKKLVESCLTYDPTERPTAEKLLGDAFFKKHDQGADWLRVNFTNGLEPKNAAAKKTRRRLTNQRVIDRLLRAEEALSR